MFECLPLSDFANWQKVERYTLLYVCLHVLVVYLFYPVDLNVGSSCFSSFPFVLTMRLIRGVEGDE